MEFIYILTYILYAVFKASLHLLCCHDLLQSVWYGPVCSVGFLECFNVSLISMYLTYNCYPCYFYVWTMHDSIKARMYMYHSFYCDLCYSLNGD